MHEASAHVAEAQRLAEELLHRMLRPMNSPHGDRQLPPLRAQRHTEMVVPKPTLASAKRGLAPLASTRGDVAPGLMSCNVREKQGKKKQSSPARKSGAGGVRRSFLPPARKTLKDAPAASSQQQHETVDDVVEQRAVPSLSPLAQFLESESVERSIIITMWELERSKLESRIGKTWLLYFTWLQEELEAEMADGRVEIEEEEDMSRAVVWNKYEIKTKLFYQRMVADLFTREKDCRYSVVSAEASERLTLPERAGHDKFVFFEDECRERRYVSEEAANRLIMISTKFFSREYVINESNLRKWIETLEDEVWRTTILWPLKALCHFSVASAALVEKEVTLRRELEDEYDVDVPYYERYKLQLTDLNGDTTFWSEKRDIEYHESIRRLFHASHEQQERQELLSTFTSFMLLRGAVAFNKTGLTTLLHNEWLRRAFLAGAEAKERRSLQALNDAVMEDYEDSVSARVRQDAVDAIQSFKNEPTYDTYATFGTHEGIRRTFITQEEESSRRRLIFGLELLLEEADDAAGATPLDLRSDNLPEELSYNEAVRRAFLATLMSREYSTIIAMEERERVSLLEDVIDSVLHNEAVRRAILANQERRLFVALCKSAFDYRVYVTDVQATTFDAAVFMHVVDGEEVMRLCAAEDEVVDRRNLFLEFRRALQQYEIWSGISDVREREDALDQDRPRFLTGSSQMDDAADFEDHVGDIELDEPAENGNALQSTTEVDMQELASAVAKLAAEVALERSQSDNEFASSRVSV